MRYSVNTDGSMKDNKTGKKVILNAETGSSDKTLLAIHNLTEDIQSPEKEQTTNPKQNSKNKEI